MSVRMRSGVAGGGALLVLLAGLARADADELPRPDAPAEPTAVSRSSWRLEPGPRSFHRRVAFSPAFGAFGEQPLYAARVAFNPGNWIGYEAELGHSPGRSVHALLHSFSAIVRRPFQGRFQPYLVGGYGMYFVYPGAALNADPVTKNVLLGGGGLEAYLREDVALRFDLRGAMILGPDGSGEGTASYEYREATVGFSFYRGLGR